MYFIPTHIETGIRRNIQLFSQCGGRGGGRGGRLSAGLKWAERTLNWPR